jgi:hypothetical protein
MVEIGILNLIEGEEESYVNVDSDNCYRESNAFDYEYGSIRGTYDPGDTWVVEDITWNKSEFTVEQNIIIEKHINDNYDSISDNIIKEKQKDNEWN